MRRLTLTDLPSHIQHATHRHRLLPRQILLQQGDFASHLYWVASGQLRLVSFVQQKMITHYSVEAGDLLGATALYFETYGCTVIADTDAEVVAIPKAAFERAWQQSPSLSQRYLASLTHRFHSTKALLELRSIPSARDRLLHYLMQRCPPGERTVILKKPLKAIASDLALTPEGLSRLLARLQADGMINRKKRSISLSQEVLETMSE